MPIELTTSFEASPDALWEIVGTPDRVDWVPGASECHFDGEVRRLLMSGAGEIAERILSLESTERRIRYSCIESSPPLEEHLAEIHVIPGVSGGCEMIWKTTVKPEAVEPFILGQMHTSIEQLKTLLA